MYGRDDNGSEGPKGTFEIYRAEADSLYKQGEYRKSIESYTIALELTPNEKNCLVSRSKCYLQLGDMQSALIDAEASLEEEKDFHKGIYQKAQALYYQGDFEMALVFYHRGHRLRPELQEFRLGIQKAQEAIDNSVGSPETVKLTTEGDLSYFSQQDEKKLKRKGKTYGRPIQQVEQKKVRDPKAAGSDKTIKQLLGELYGDRQYLEKLLKETDANTDMGKMISNLVTEGLSYLDTRSDFWRQQKPMYARRHERLKQRRRPDVSSSKLSPNDYIIKELERIDQAQCEGRYKEALQRSQKCLSTVQTFSEDLVPNKIEVIANLYGCIGNAYLEMGSYEKALENHHTDLRMGEANDMSEAVSRGLDNIGRVHARSGAFDKAIEVWERKLPMSKSPLESTWLYHEIGRCYLEINKFSQAKDYGEQSYRAAVEAEDNMWQLQASVLIAQAEVKLSELESAAATFEKALNLAKSQGDSSAEAAIQKAIDEVNGRIASGEGLVNNTNNTGGDATETKETAEHEDTNQSTNKDTNQGENKDTNQNANKDTNQNANKDTNQGANNSEKGEDEQKEQAKDTGQDEVDKQEKEGEEKKEEEEKKSVKKVTIKEEEKEEEGKTEGNQEDEQNKTDTT